MKDIFLVLPRTMAMAMMMVAPGPKKTSSRFYPLILFMPKIILRSMSFWLKS